MSGRSEAQPSSKRRVWPVVLRRLSRALSRSGMSDRSLMLLLGVLVGVGAGGGAVAFRWLISSFHSLFFDHIASLFWFMGASRVLLLPALGGLLVGLLTYFLAREAKGHGVPEVMEAVAIHGGRIRARVALVKSLASSVCIGSGGSVGREGPIVQIGAGLGSSLAQLLGLGEGRTRTLLAAGAAGGIAATFNAPLAGTFFALEIILGDWEAEYFAPVVASAVSASAVGRLAFGDVPAFIVPEYSLSALTELPFFLVLGVLAALLSVVFIRALYGAEDLFKLLPLRRSYLWPALGGLLVGVIGLYHSELYGVGYGLIEQALLGIHQQVGFILVLLVFKIIATSATLGSGGSGGIFSPSLFLGSLLGCGVALGLSHLFPQMIITPGAYALVGMGAVLAAASHAPITAVLIVFELTGDYRMILPLMLACGTSVVMARVLYRFSIYNLKLHRRGVHFELGRDTRLLSDIKVGQAMTRELISMRPDLPVREAIRLFETTKHHGFPVVDEQGRLRGCLTLTDVRNAGPEGLDKQVSDIATHDLVVAFPQETLNDALRKMGLRDVGRLPVVHPEDHTQIIGLITRKNVISAYNRALMRRHTRLEETAEEEHFD